MLTATNPQNSTASLSTDPSLVNAGTTANSLTTNDLKLVNRSSASATLTAPAPGSTTTYISDLPWTSATNGWGPVEKNLSNGEQGAGDGRTITLNGVTYSKGLGVHANSEINYNLGGKYSKFSSDIGIDAETGGRGAVAFQVWADGTKLFDSGVVTGTSATQKVNVDVTGKNALKLVVTPGADTSSDHADWAGASLLSAATVTPTPTPTPAPLDINDKPVIMVPSGSKGTTQSVSLPIAGITVSDADAGSGNLTVTLSAEHGTLAVNGNISGGVKLANISSNGTGSVVLIGTLLQINATLADPSGLLYKSNTGFVGTDRVNIVANDNGNSGAGGAQTGSQSLSIVVNGTSTTGGTSGSPAGSGSSYPNSTSPLGINLSDPADYSSEVPFVDGFKTSRSWISNKEGAGWDQGGQLSVNKEGWVTSLQPGQYATTIVLDNGGHYPEGNYTLLYDGQGKIDVSGFSGQGLTVVSQAPGRIVVSLKSVANGAFINLRETNAADPVRNIRFIMPGAESTYQTQPFNPKFLETVSKFKSLRFMDWEKTNNSSLANWADRTTTSSVTQAGSKGVALEYMIQLANTTHADPWFTIPAGASDDYVRQFATVVRDKLDPSLKAHIEYSNEVWNFGFEQAGYARDQGVRLGLDSDQYIAGAKYYSQRSVEIFKIFETVMGGTSRLDRVLAWQSPNTYTGEKVVTWKDAYKSADAYAIAPYFNGGYDNLLNPSKASQIVQMSQSQILDALQADIRGTIKNDIVGSSNLARKYGLKLEAYEGGQHLISYQFGSYEPQITKLYADVNRNPRMKDLYKEYLDEWKQAGGGLFNQFNDVSTPSKYGSWGALEYLGQPASESPKYQALIEYIAANPVSK